MSREVATPIEGIWSRRGYLPHFDGPEVTQFVTIRLADTLPAERLAAWKKEVSRLPPAVRQAVLSRRIDRYLDRGEGPKFLEDRRVAILVERSLLHFDGDRYKLHAWVIMPTHVHTSLTPSAGLTLKSILKSFKSFTGRRANEILGREGRFWQKDFYDRAIRDEAHFKRTIWYIHENPVKANLCEAAEEYRWSSAWERRSFGDCM